MRFAWPVSQIRVSLKWGNIDSGESSVVAEDASVVSLEGLVAVCSASEDCCASTVEGAAKKREKMNTACRIAAAVGRIMLLSRRLVCGFIVTRKSNMKREIAVMSVRGTG